MWLASRAADPEVAYGCLLTAASIQPEFGAPPEIVLGTLGRAALLFPTRRRPYELAEQCMRQHGLFDHANQLGMWIGTLPPEACN